MRQPIKRNISAEAKAPSPPTPTKKVKGTTFKPKKRNHKAYGTSKLELDFAREYLDKNGIKYIYQYHAKEIGRYFDFAVVDNNSRYETEIKDGLTCVKQEGQKCRIQFLIEVDGSYYHADERIVDESKLSPMQKHNKFVDKLKDEYAGMHCIPILRLWEIDIRKNPQLVNESLGKYVDLGISNTKKKFKLHDKFLK